MRRPGPLGGLRLPGLGLSRLGLSRLGLRARVVALFALGALALSVVLALATYSVTRNNLLGERERSNIRGAQLDAKIAQDNLALRDADPLDVLDNNIDGGPLRRPVLLGPNGPISSTSETSAAISPALRQLVADGSSGAQRVKVNGVPTFVVGIPLELTNRDFDYFEVGSLADLNDTLRSLGATLTLFAALTTIAGAGLGFSVSKRLLAPLASVAEAARAIGEGDLSARLDPSDDRDLRAITRSFNTMVDQLASRLERDRRFAADVSHELRSPLQTLTAASSVLVRQKDAMDKRTGSAAVLVAEEVARFSELVRDLLELSRDEVPLSLREADLPALVGDISRGLVRKSGLDLKKAPAHWPLDVQRFERLLSNLLQNAKKHGGGAVRVGAQVIDGALVVEVDDAGPGVPVEERELVFDRFGRGRAASARGISDGTGLGLALVKQHTEAHGGTVVVLDRPGGGARFRVTLPRPAESEDRS